MLEALLRASQAFLRAEDLLERYGTSLGYSRKRTKFDDGTSSKLAVGSTRPDWTCPGQASELGKSGQMNTPPAGLSPTSRDAVAEATWQRTRLPVVLEARRSGQPHLRCQRSDDSSPGRWPEPSPAERGHPRP